MNNLYFIIFSGIETSSLIILIMTVFRFNFRENKIKVIICALSFSILSLMIEKLGLHNYNILIQIPLVVLMFKYVFKENGKYSIWISVLGYITFIFLEGVIATMSMIYGFMDASDMMPFTLKGYEMQLLSSIIILLVSTYVKSFNEGFSFDFNNPFKQKKNLKSSNPYIWIVTVSFVVTAITYPISFYGSNMGVSFLISTLLSVVSLSTLFFLSIKRNKEEALSILK